MKLKYIAARGFGPALSVILAPLLLQGCASNDVPLPAPPPTAQAPATAAPQLLDAGFQVETVTLEGVIESVDLPQRKVTIRHSKGVKTYKAGAEVANLAQLKPGDEVVATVTDACAIFLVKGNVAPSVAVGGVFARAPKGGVALETLDYNAKILDIDRETRRVLLQYGTNAATSVQVGPNVNLAEININDDVLVRATESMAIMVEQPAKK